MNQQIKSAESANHITVFQEAAIRRTWHNEESDSPQNGVRKYERKI